MAIQLPATFVQDFEREYHTKFQQKRSLLRTAARVKTDVIGNTANFPVIGAGVATSKSRHGNVVAMEATRSSVTCTITDHYAPEYIDMLDLSKIAHDDRSASIDTATAALKRKCDDIAIAALNTVGATVAAGTTGLTIAKIKEAQSALGDNDAFEPGQMFAFLGWEQWGELQSLVEFSSSDYNNGPGPLPNVTLPPESRYWRGTIWTPSNRLTAADSVRKCYWYNKNALGLAFGVEENLDIAWVAEKAAWLINGMMTAGACVIDSTGIARIDCVEA